MKCSYVEINLQWSNSATSDTYEEREFTSRYTLCFGAVELSRTNIPVTFTSVILIVYFSQMVIVFTKTGKKISSVREAIDLKIRNHKSSCVIRLLFL